MIDTIFIGLLILIIILLIAKDIPPSGYTRLNLELSHDTMKELKKATRKAEMKDTAEFIRHAVILYDFCVDHTGRDKKLLLRDEDGNEWEIPLVGNSYKRKDEK
jgi:hypothetical protein